MCSVVSLLSWGCWFVWGWGAGGGGALNVTKPVICNGLVPCVSPKPMNLCTGISKLLFLGRKPSICGGTGGPVPPQNPRETGKGGVAPHLFLLFLGRDGAASTAVGRRLGRIGRTIGRPSSKSRGRKRGKPYTVRDFIQKQLRSGQGPLLFVGFAMFDSFPWVSGRCSKPPAIF